MKSLKNTKRRRTCIAQLLETAGEDEERLEYFGKAAALYEDCGNFRRPEFLGKNHLPGKL